MTRVKVCFVMDCTASMGPWIRQAQIKTTKIVHDIRHDHPTADVRVAFVGYRDYDDIERFVVHNFAKPETTMRSIRHVEPLGGDDLAEDVAHALAKTLHLDWSDADVRMVIHIADAPAHGDAFHRPTVSDRFPEGDPEGLDPRDFIEKFSFLDIEYTFVSITKDTDVMIEAFYDCYKQGGTFRVIDLQEQGAEAMSHALSQTISESITQHTASQVP
jgi:hypothetical protein